MDLPLPTSRLTRLENFGHSLVSPAFLYRPTHLDQVAECFELAKKRGVSVALRGAARSYGDVSLNSGGLVLDFQRMNRILDWDPHTGVIRVEPGVTIQQIWQHILEDGWWPPVVPGTMFPTIAGCLATNVHGKNNHQAGTIGEQVLSFNALLPTGEELTCTPKHNKDLFYGLIGGLGLLGVFTSITLKMKRVYSGNLWVTAWAQDNLEGLLTDLEAHKSLSDYVVGWVDTTARGRALGRGQIHRADYLYADEDPNATQTLNVDYQTLPDTLLGLIPKSIVWKLMQPVMNNVGLLAVNSAKFWASRTIGDQQRYLQSHAAFNFLLDYIPNWERAYGPGGMIQYQSFIPTDKAPAAFREMLQISLQNRIPSFLGVVKRHRPDRFLLSHAVDGFSLALDFRVPHDRRAALREQTATFNRITLDAGGRFYFAKDSTLTPDVVAQFLGQETLAQFQALKNRCDPKEILQSDLYRRCLAPAVQQARSAVRSTGGEPIHSNPNQLAIE